jgi:NAD(P)H-dependent FMN reductase
MRSDIHQGDLPHEEAHSSIASDVSSFRAISEAADVVFFACAKQLHGSG